MCNHLDHINSDYLDTLYLDTHKQKTPPPPEDVKEVSHIPEIEIVNRVEWQLKNEKKIVSKHLNTLLAQLDSPLKNQYLEATACSEVLLASPEYGHVIIKSDSCNRRTCLMCANKRTAKVIKSYEKQIEAFTDPYFVTVTAGQRVSKEGLEERIKAVFNRKSIIAKKMRERTKNPLQALIAIEIIHNNNPLSKQYDTYHVHLHCIINGYTQSLSFVQRWLNGFPQATKAAQSIKQIYDIGKSLKEICKYITKLDINKATSIEAIDTIIQATKGRRLIEAYGIKKNRDNKLKKTAVNFKPLKAEVYIWQSYEWYSAYEPFSNFKPTKPLHNEILKIKEKQINSNKINTRGTPTINRISRSPKPKETFTDHKESYTEGSKELVFTHSLKSNTLTST